MSTPARYDVAVIGAGMVGATAASLLARCGFSVALVEGRKPAVPDPDSDYGLRVSALSPGSQAILEQAGAWRAIEAGRHCVYRRMEIEDREAGSALSLDAPAFGLDRLGVIAENDLVQSALWNTLESNHMVDTFCPDRLVGLDMGQSAATVELESGAHLCAELLIGADGPESAVRRLAGIGQDIWEYNQAGLVCVAEKQQHNPGIAWQRFLAGGPLAFLPLADGRSSIVWTLPAGEAARLEHLDSSRFAVELQSASEGWLGDIKAIGPRGLFPLAMRLSHGHVAGRLVMLGDAAHVVHPLAGQGVNLGIGDAAALVETLADNRGNGKDLADPVGLRAYEIWRKSESGLMSWGIHGLGSLFGLEAIGGLRQMGMGVVSRSWILKDAFVRRAAGLNRNAPRLSRGGDLKSLLRYP